jgi:hypothetical protein
MDVVAGTDGKRGGNQAELRRAVALTLRCFRHCVVLALYPGHSIHGTFARIVQAMFDERACLFM